MVKLHKHVVFKNEGDDTFSIVETGDLKDMQAAKKWLANNAQENVAYRTGTILARDIKAEKAQKTKLVVG